VGDGAMLNIIVPIAGEGKSFQESGYVFPKSLVEVNGKPMIECVSDNLKMKMEHRFIFITKKNDCEEFALDSVLELIDLNCVIIQNYSNTAGALCSALLAIEHIDNNSPLLIANGDQIIDIDLDGVINEFMSKDLDGGIITFTSIHPRWSYVRVNENNLAVEVAEKRPISDKATTGVYYFKKGSDFVDAAKELIRKDAKIKGQFYICPAYNELILQNKKIGIHHIDKEKMHSMGTPEELKQYERVISQRR
jgi:NDP-sugar pyrophosphorylase family protein